MFTFDPGVKCGWAWCVVGASELGRYGAEGAVIRAYGDWKPEKGRRASRDAARASNGGDRRFRCGEINTHAGDIETGRSVVEEAVKCCAIGKRVSRGKVPMVTHLVGEGFNFREKTQSRYMLSPIRVLAAAEAFMTMHACLAGATVSTQMPAAKGIVTDERLERWGLWQPGKPHANDAIRHLIVLLRSVL